MVGRATLLGSEPYTVVGVPASELTPGQSAESTAQSGFNAALMAVFAGLALLLAAVSIYGVMPYAAATRTQEIGVRMALGAAPAQVRNMVAFHGMRKALAGISIGAVSAYGLECMTAALIYGVETTDPLTFAFAAAALSPVALAAAYLPARRATRIDPMEALRSQ
jgi:ABC-type antimicrobial peptide transport system permease subunit